MVRDMGSTATNWHARSRELAMVAFWNRVTVTEGCWEWQARRTRKGYGQMQSKWFASKATHRIAWEIAYGPIPDGLHVLHTCDNPPCIRPDHLRLGTNHDNILDMLAKGRQPRRGSRNPAAKLTEAQVAGVKRALLTGRTNVSIGREFGISEKQVSNIKCGVTWTHVEAA